MSFGLIMAGFAGHAVFPTIYRDMKSPKRYNEMVNYTYLVTALVYMTIAACGYAMFGSNTMQEVNIISVRKSRISGWEISVSYMRYKHLCIQNFIFYCILYQSTSIYILTFII